jgi:hypothetical protein
MPKKFVPFGKMSAKGKKPGKKGKKPFGKK